MFFIACSNVFSVIAKIEIAQFVPLMWKDTWSAKFILSTVAGEWTCLFSQCFQTVTNIGCFQMLTRKDFWTQGTMLINWWSSNKDHLSSGYNSLLFFKTLLHSCKVCFCPVSSSQQMMTRGCKSTSPFEEPLGTTHRSQASNGNKTK